MISNAMGLQIPVPQITTGPLYATQVSEDLEVIASHTHTGESNADGYQIPTAGLNINEDLSIQSNNLTNIRTNKFTNLLLNPSGIGDVGCIYEKLGDLWYNNAAGVQIQLTSGGTINFVNNINYEVLAINANYTIDYTDILTVLECDSSSNTITITLPSISDVPSGRLYIVKDATGSSEFREIIINPSGIDTIDEGSVYRIEDDYAAVSFISDGVGNWTVYPFNRKVYFAGDVIQLTETAELTAGPSTVVDLEGTFTSVTAGITTAVITTLTATNETVTNNLNVNNLIGGTSGGTLGVATAITSPSYLFTNAIGGRVKVGKSGGNSTEARWVYDSFGLWTNASVGGILDFNIDLPNGVQVNSIAISIEGASGHGALPAVMPEVIYRRYSTASNLYVTIGSQIDTSANVTAFELQHFITISGLTDVVNNSVNSYAIRIVAESGADSAIGEVIYYYSISYTIPAGYSFIP